MNRAVHRLGKALAALVILGVLAAACRGSPGARVANLGPKSTTTTTSGSSLPSSARLLADALRYSVCMRSRGLSDFPDPKMGSNGLPGWNISQSTDAGSTQFKAAQRVCRKDLPDLEPTTPAEKAAANAKALTYTECMRSHGEPDFPDPNGEGLIRIANATGTLAPDSPRFQRAQSACLSLDSGFVEQGSSAVAGGHPSGAQVPDSGGNGS